MIIKNILKKIIVSWKNDIRIASIWEILVWYIIVLRQQMPCKKRWDMNIIWQWIYLILYQPLYHYTFCFKVNAAGTRWKLFPWWCTYVFSSMQNLTQFSLSTNCCMDERVYDIDVWFLSIQGIQSFVQNLFLPITWHVLHII